MAALATIGAAGMLAYGGGFDGAFLFDDHRDIDANPAIRSLWPLSQVLLGQGQSGVGGRPLVALTYALNYAWGGYDVWGWHAVNLAIHILTACFLYGAIRRALASPPFEARWKRAATGVALATATIWVAHPLTTGAVQYLGERVESLMGMFFAATFYFALRSFGEPTARRWPVLACIACALGTGCKEVIVGAPLLVWLFDAQFVSHSFGAAWRARRGMYLGLFSSWLLIAAWVVLAEGRSESVGFGDTQIGVWNYLTTQAWAVALYARLSLWPVPLCFDYGVQPITDVAVWGPNAALVVAALAWTVHGLLRGRSLAYLGAWWIVILAPSSSFLPIVTELAVEHRAYLPSVAIVFAAVLGAYSLVAATRLTAAVKRGVLVAAASIVVVSAVFATRARCRDYATEIGMWQDVVAKRPNNARGRASYGNDLITAGREAEAGVQFEAAVRLSPDDPYWRSNWGTWLCNQNRNDEAIVELERSLELLPTYGMTLQNLGWAYFRKQDTARAIELWRRSLDHGAPRAEPVARQLWLLHRAAGREAEALDAARAGAAAAPEDLLALKLLAQALLQAKDAKLRSPAEAAAWIERARRMSPGDPELVEWLGECHAQLGRTTLAASAFQAAAAAWRAAGSASRAQSCEQRAAALAR